jgi:hypothetical protein
MHCGRRHAPLYSALLEKSDNPRKRGKAVEHYHNTLSTRPISERIQFRLTNEDKRAVLALRDLLRPTMPLATRTDIIRAALRAAVEALGEKR